MPDVLRIKRRAVGGAAGAPSSLAASEIAFNEQTNILYYGGGNSLGLATSIFAIGGSGAFLTLAGGALTGGLSFGSTVAASTSDLTRHITLYSPGYGFSITGGRLNIVSAINHFFVVGTADVAQISATGINNTAIGATTPLTGAFTTLTATSPAVGTTDTNVATTLFAARLLGYLNNGSLPGFDSDLTITTAQAGQRIVRFTGALTADRTYTLPSTNQRNWILWNNTTGGYNLIFTLGGTTISIPSGYRGEIFNDTAGVFGAHNCLPAGSLRIGPGGDRNAVLITTGATAATATTIEATGTGAINWITGLGFGTALAPGGVADLTRHLSLYSTTYGFSITTNRLNYNVGAAGAHVFLVGGTDVGSITTAGAQLIGTPTAPTAAASVNNTQIATTAYVTTAIAAYSDDIGRNYIHNGLFRIWQRGSVSFTTHLNFTADRWQMWKGADTMTVTRQTLIDTERTQIGDEDAAYALQAAVVGTAAAGDNAVMQQRIEGVRRLSNKQITVSFYAVATSGTPKIGISWDQVFGSGGSPSTQVSGAGTSVTITNAAWARYSVSLTLPSCSGKTLGTNGDDSTAINLWLSSGATNNTRAGLIGVQTVTAKFWGVQVEIGALTPMEKIDQSLDWNNCQRFYQATVIGLGGYAAAGALFGYYVTLPVAMQKVPTVNIVSPTYTNASAGAANSISQTSFFAQATATALGTCSFLYTYLASADL